jgi:uncharacterized membrane protein YbhN (UPF0104 family)
MQRPAVSKRLRALAALALTVLAGWLVVRGVDARGVWSALRRAPPLHAAAVGAVALAAQVARAQRWQWLLADAGAPALPLRDLVLVRSGTQGAALALPLKSGEVARAVCLARLGVPMATTMGTVVAEKVLVLAASAVLALAAWALQPGPASLAGLAGGALAVAAFLAAPTGAAHRLAVRAASRALGAEAAGRLLALMATPPRRRAALLAHSVALRAAELAMLVASLDAVGARLEPRATLLAGSLVGLSSLLPFTVAGLGVREGTLVALFAGAAPDEALLAAGLLFFALSQVLPAAAGLPLAWPLWRRMERAGAA